MEVVTAGRPDLPFHLGISPSHNSPRVAKQSVWKVCRYGEQDP